MLQNPTPNNRETYITISTWWWWSYCRRYNIPSKVSLSSKATVYLCRKVNGYNGCEGGSENAHAMAEYIWDNPKTSFCALRWDKVYRHCFDGEKQLMWLSCHVGVVLNALATWKKTNILCQHGRTSHIHMELTTFSNRQLPTDGSARGIHYLVPMISKLDPLTLLSRTL
jgi:hypothetical protein